MTEAGLQAALLKLLRSTLEGFIILSHTDGMRSGVPDVSVTGNGFTSWWELKHATPRFTSYGLQELTIMRLARAGFARYIIYGEDVKGHNKQTRIVEPRHLGEWMAEGESANGFDHHFVTNYIRGVHNYEHDVRETFRVYRS